MKHLFFALLVLSTSPVFGKENDPPVETQVAELVTHLKQYSQIKDAFPAKLIGASERTRGYIAKIIESYGSEPMPYIVSFGPVVRAFSGSGEAEKIQFHSFNPLEFTLNGEDFSYKSLEDFYDSVARPASKKTVYNLFIDQVFAKGASGKTMLAGTAGYLVGWVYTKSNASTSGGSGKTAMGKKVDDHKNQMETLSTSVAANFPNVTCEGYEEKLFPFSTVTYRTENKVTITRYKPNDSPSYLELRANQIDGNSFYVFCANDKSKCEKMDFYTDKAMNEKLLSPMRESAIKAEKANVDALLSEMDYAFRELKNHFHSEGSFSGRKKFIKDRAIKYPKTTKPEDFIAELQSDAAIERAYKRYQAIKEDLEIASLEKGNLYNKAMAQWHRMNRLSKEDFRDVYLYHMGRNGFSDEKPKQRSDDNYYLTRHAFDVFIEEEIEKKRPFNSESASWFLEQKPHLMLAPQDEKQFADSKPQRTAELMSVLKVKEAKVLEAVKKGQVYLKLKTNEAVPSCDPNRGVVWRNPPNDNVEWQYRVMECNLRARYETLKNTSLSSHFANVGGDVLEMAHCCLDSQCKASALKKVTDKKMARETQYDRVKQN